MNQAGLGFGISIHTVEPTGKTMKLPNFCVSAESQTSRGFGSADVSQGRPHACLQQSDGSSSLLCADLLPLCSIPQL